MQVRRRVTTQLKNDPEAPSQAFPLSLALFSSSTGDEWRVTKATRESASVELATVKLKAANE